MDFLASPLGVFVILAIVAVAVVNFEPASYVGAWRELAERYASDQRPSSTAFCGESIRLGSAGWSPMSWFPDYSQVDIALDDDAFWIVYSGPNPEKAPDILCIPWDCVRYRRTKHDRQNFQLRGHDPIELWVSVELGDAMQRRSLRFEIEDQL